MKRRSFISALILAICAPFFLLFRRKPFIFVDELSLIHQDLVDAARKNIISGEPFEMINIGSPESFYDQHGEFVWPRRGWCDIPDTDQKWSTKKGFCIRFDGEKQS